MVVEELEVEQTALLKVVVQLFMAVVTLPGPARSAEFLDIAVYILPIDSNGMRTVILKILYLFRSDFVFY